MRNYLSHHIQAAISSLGRMTRSPLSSLMTILVIGVSLALPSILWVSLQNAKVLSEHWNKGIQISLYLRANVSPADKDQLMTELRANSSISEVRYISPEQGLKEFQAQANINNALADLPQNPLPAVIEIYPSPMAQNVLDIKTLIAQMQQKPYVESAQYDLEWVQRLMSILDVGKQIVMALVVILIALVLLIIMNTTRLSTKSRREEIEIIKLIGAKNSFVRRPFLYTGIYYGAFGSLFALCLVEGLISWLLPSFERLAGLYQSHFAFEGLPVFDSLLLIIAGGTLGLIAAWVAVHRELRLHRFGSEKF